MNKWIRVLAIIIAILMVVSILAVFVSQSFLGY